LLPQPRFRLDLALHLAELTLDQLPPIGVAFTASVSDCSCSCRF
jgi:hypothetical protein